MKKTWKDGTKAAAVLLAAVLGFSGCAEPAEGGETSGMQSDVRGSTSGGQTGSLPYVTAEELMAEIKTAPNGAGVSVHDPSIKKFNGRYYLYGSHMTGACSDDLQTWTTIGDGYTPDNPLFDNLFADGLGIFDYAGDYGDGTYDVWAEDVIYLEQMQKYVMYFCVSSTYVKSNLCYAVAD